MIEIRYRCKCLVAEVAVQVPERREGEDVVAWVEGVVGTALYLDHRGRSPDCRRSAVEYAKIPAPENAPFLGGKPEVN